MIFRRKWRVEAGAAEKLREMGCAVAEFSNRKRTNEIGFWGGFGRDLGGVLAGFWSFGIK